VISESPGAQSRIAHLGGGVPAPLLMVAAMISFQLGAAVATGLFARVGVSGTAFLRNMVGGVLLLAIARPNLRRAQPIVRRFCAEHAITYTETTVPRSYRIVIRHLNHVGLRAADPFQCPLAATLRPRT